jgi:hypothetical protein
LAGFVFRLGLGFTTSHFYQFPELKLITTFDEEKTGDWSYLTLYKSLEKVTELLS